jgi:hypothetical protein
MADNSMATDKEGVCCLDADYRRLNITEQVDRSKMEKFLVSNNSLPGEGSDHRPAKLQDGRVLPLIAIKSLQRD